MRFRELIYTALLIFSCSGNGLGYDPANFRTPRRWAYAVLSAATARECRECMFPTDRLGRLQEATGAIRWIPENLTDMSSW